MKNSVTEPEQQVLWLAECYSLAKRFHDPHTWMSLLEGNQMKDDAHYGPFDYWLWMEIWKAAQTPGKSS